VPSNFSTPAVKLTDQRVDVLAMAAGHGAMLAM
jgi:hypothetical protein